MVGDQGRDLRQPHQHALDGGSSIDDALEATAGFELA